MSGFSIPLDQLAAKLKLELDTVVRKSTLDVFSAVVRRSPVGNPDAWKSAAPKGYVGGRFRANWNCSQGEPDLSTTDSTGQQRGSDEAQKALTFASGGVVYFTNSLPYAYRLENEGWSKQAPAGMVKVTVTEFDQYVRAAIA